MFQHALFACHMHTTVVLTFIMFCCRLQSVDDVAMVTPMCNKTKESDCQQVFNPSVGSLMPPTVSSSSAITPVSVVTAFFILLCAVLVVVLVIMVILILRTRNSRSSVSINDQFGTVESGNKTEKQAGNQNGNQTGRQNENQGNNHYENVDPEKDDYVIRNKDSA